MRPGHLPPSRRLSSWDLWCTPAAAIGQFELPSTRTPRTRKSRKAEKSRSCVTRTSAPIARALGSLNSVRKLQSKCGPESSCTLCNLRIEIHDEPGLECGAVSLGQHFVPSAQRSGEHLGKGDGGHRETHKAALVSLEHRSEYRREVRVILEHIDDGSGVDKEQGVLRQSLQTHRSPFISQGAQRRLTVVAIEPAASPGQRQKRPLGVCLTTARDRCQYCDRSPMPGNDRLPPMLRGGQ